jgi:ribosomal protein L13
VIKLTQSQLDVSKQAEHKREPSKDSKMKTKDIVKKQEECIYLDIQVANMLFWRSRSRENFRKRI